MPFYVPPEQMMKDRGGLRAEGHRPRAQPRRAQRAPTASCSSPRTRSARCTRSARSTTASRSRASASTTSSRCCESPACARPTSKGYSFAREDVNAERLANAYAPDARPGLHPRDEALRGRDPRGRRWASGRRADELYHILYDGTVMDEEGSTVLGGQAEEIAEAMESRFSTDMDLGGGDPARRVGARRSRHRAHRRPARGRAPRPHPRPPRVPPHQGRRARRHPRRRLTQLALPVAHAAPRNRASTDAPRAGSPRPTRAIAVDVGGAIGAGIPPLGRGDEGGVDLVGEEHVAGVVELVLGHVDVDPRHVAHGEPVRARPARPGAARRCPPTRAGPRAPGPGRRLRPR